MNNKKEETFSFLNRKQSCSGSSHLADVAAIMAATPHTPENTARSFLSERERSEEQSELWKPTPQ